MNQAVNEVQNLTAGRPGGMNAFVNRWGKLVVDYATAIIPDRSEPFEKMVEDILVDAISQARAVKGAQSDAAVRDFVIESALRTVRARYRAQLDAPPAPSKATNSYTVEEVLARTGLSGEEITAGISEGRIRAVRSNDVMKVKGRDVPGLGERENVRAWQLSAAQRELLCLHYRLDLAADRIAQLSGAATAQVEGAIQTAAARISTARGGGRNVAADAQDTEMRRYVEGRLSDDESSKFENRVLKDKLAQRRLEEIRGQHEAIRSLFDSPPYDMSQVSVNARARNPHQPMALPPAVALWVQAVGVAALLLLLHRVGAYLPPPEVLLNTTEGAVSIDGSHPPASLSGARVVVGQSVNTGEGGQALLTVDNSNRVRLAGDSKLTVAEPRPDTRQVLQLDAGEMWARFISTGNAFAVTTGGERPHELRGDSAAEFGLAIGKHAQNALPDNLKPEQAAAFAAAFKQAEGGLEATRAIHMLAGLAVGEGGIGIAAGDVLTRLDRVPTDDLVVLRRALEALRSGETASLQLRRGSETVSLGLKRLEVKPLLILRVYRGGLFFTQAGGEPEQVNRGQWAMVCEGQPLLIGQRGLEDFRLLRMDGADRFKDRLHWLNTESFPLRAENNLLLVERSLHELANKLERLRADEVRRNGGAEIARFEEVMQAAIAAAKERIAKGEGKPRTPVPGALSDEELVAAKDEILGTVADWKRRASTGAWPTLGSAGKTLHGRIQKDSDDMLVRESDMTRAQVIKQEIEADEKNIALKQAEIAKLNANPLLDADGSKRKALDEQIAKLGETVRAGNEANSRIELIMLKLNELDSRLDDLRRKLPTQKAAVATAELELADIDKRLAANIYTPAALTKAEADVVTATEAAVTAAKTLTEREKDFAAADSALALARTAHGKADKDAAPLVAARDKAQDALTDSLADRTAAQKVLDDRKAEVESLQRQYDALPQGDPKRAELKTKLDAAKAAQSDAQKTLDAAKSAADKAKAAFDAADTKANAAQKTADDAKTARDKAQTARDDAVKNRDDADAADKAAKRSEREANTLVDNLKAAKIERETLDARRLENVERLKNERAGLLKLENDIAALDADAQPRREKLAEERKITASGEEAAKQIEQCRRDRGAHQAISDDIDLRTRDLDSLTRQRDERANSTLVKGYDALVAEYRQLSARVDAMKFLRDRALLEDKEFEAAQRQAMDHYRETAIAISGQAEAVLDKACLAYPGFSLADSDADSKLVRGKLLAAMWRLYYDPGIEPSPDGAAGACYYVALQSGSEEALRVVDDRWKLALAQVFDKDRYEKASRLKPEDLGAAGKGQ